MARPYDELTRQAPQPTPQNGSAQRIANNLDRRGLLGNGGCNRPLYRLGILSRYGDHSNKVSKLVHLIGEDSLFGLGQQHRCLI
jgi:hypothetical protein